MSWPISLWVDQTSLWVDWTSLSWPNIRMTFQNIRMRSPNIPMNRPITFMSLPNIIMSTPNIIMSSPNIHMIWPTSGCVEWTSWWVDQYPYELTNCLMSWPKNLRTLYVIAIVKITPVTCLLHQVKHSDSCRSGQWVASYSSSIKQLATQWK